MRTATAETQLTAAISKALGYRHTRRIGAHENAACLTLWDVRSVQDAYARLGGTVTARRVIRRYDDHTTAPVIEVVLTADIDGVGSVALNTDWDPADEAYGWELPVVKACTVTV